MKYEKKLDEAVRKTDLMGWLWRNGFVPYSIAKVIRERFISGDRILRNISRKDKDSFWDAPYRHIDDLPKYVFNPSKDSYIEFMDDCSFVNHKGASIVLVQHFPSYIGEDNYFHFFTSCPEIKTELSGYIRRIKRYVSLANEERRVEMESYRSTTRGAYEYARNLFMDILDEFKPPSRYELIHDTYHHHNACGRVYVNDEQKCQVIRIFFHAHNSRGQFEINMELFAEDPVLQSKLNNHFEKVCEAVDEVRQAKLYDKLKGE